MALVPNPAHDYLQIGLQDTTDTIKNITVYDVTGKAVKNVAVGNSNQMSLYIATLSSGIYMVEVTTENNRKEVKKLIKR